MDETRHTASDILEVDVLVGLLGSGHDDLLRLRDELRERISGSDMLDAGVEKRQTFVLNYETMLQEHA